MYASHTRKKKMLLKYNWPMQSETQAVTKALIVDDFDSQLLAYLVTSVVFREQLKRITINRLVDF